MSHDRPQASRTTTAEPGSINFAWDAAVQGSTGRVFVANRESHEIEVFEADGTYVTRWGTRGTAPGSFTFPQGIAFDPTDGSLLVADSGNGRIERFSIGADGTGTFLTSYGSKGTAAGQFSTPTGVDVSPDGTIWVADTGNDRLVRMGPGGALRAVVDAASLGLTSMDGPFGAAFGLDGTIYVSVVWDNRILELTQS